MTLKSLLKRGTRVQNEKWYNFQCHSAFCHPSLRFLMILRCFHCYEINLDYVFKAKKVTRNTLFSISRGMLSPEPFIWSQKGLEGLQNSMVPCEFSLFRHVVDFATPPYVFEVFR